jgi:thiosulfate/3-mercaptopyruvate sulfurtransferase
MLPAMARRVGRCKRHIGRHSMSAIRWLAGLGLVAMLSTPAAAQQGPVVDADWLSKNLNNQNVRIFEVSVDPGVYERGHIPGAVNIRWHSDLVDTVRRDIVSRDKFKAMLEAAGVTKDTTIVLYGDNNNWFAAWGAWVFEINGLGNQTKLLNGGRKVWEAKGLPLDNKTPTYAKSNLNLPAPKLALRARLADVSAAVEKKNAVIIDIRGPDEYTGKIFAPAGVQELSIRAGHVPGAKNVPWGQAVAADGTFKSKEELQKLYAAVGADGKQPIIVYCRIGERSSHSWFVLAKILGYNVKNYDGSWTEYGNTVGLPITNIAGTVWQGK